MANNSVKHKCYQCGSELIFVSEETVQPEGTRFKQTNTVFKCSNEDCQNTKDKEKADRIKQQKKRAEIQLQRIEQIHEKRKLTKNAKLQQD